MAHIHEYISAHVSRVTKTIRVEGDSFSYLQYIFAANNLKVVVPRPSEGCDYPVNGEVAEPEIKNSKKIKLTINQLKKDSRCNE